MCLRNSDGLLSDQNENSANHDQDEDALQTAPSIIKLLNGSGWKQLLTENLNLLETFPSFMGITHAVSLEVEATMGSLVEMYYTTWKMYANLLFLPKVPMYQSASNPHSIHVQQGVTKPV